MAGSLLPQPKQTFTDDTGKPLSGGQIYTYAAGSLTPKATYQDAAQTIANTNPVIANARGEVIMYGAGAYRVILKDKQGNTLWDRDNIQSPQSAIDSAIGSLASQLTAPGGAALVGFSHAGTYVAGTLGAKLKQSINVTDAPYNAVGDGLADDTSAINAALSAGLTVNFGGADKTYKVTGPLTLRSGHKIRGDGATITQTTALTEIFNFQNKTDILVEGVHFVGVGTDFNSSPSSRAVAIFGWYAQRVTVQRCRFTNFSGSSLSTAYSSEIAFVNNVVVGPGSPTLTALTSGACYGVTIDTGCSRVYVAGNTISQTAQGITTGNGCTDVRIIGNTVFDIVGQHGMYFGSGHVNLTIHGNTVRNVALNGVKVQNYDAPGLDAQNVSVIGNTIYGAGADGISVLSTTPSAVYKLRNVIIQGNTIRSAGQDGINTSAIVSGVISGNTIYGATRDGLSITSSDKLNVQGNILRDAGSNGILVSTATIDISVLDNQVINPAVGAVAGQKSGIHVTDGSGHKIIGNLVQDAGGKMQYGLFIEAGTQTTMAVKDNIMSGATDTGARFKNPVENLALYEGNVMSGGLADTLYLPTTNQRGSTGRVFFSGAIPTTGTWVAGDMVYNTAPVAAGAIGWVCVAGGTPGTWKAFGTIAA